MWNCTILRTRPSGVTLAVTQACLGTRCCSTILIVCFLFFVIATLISFTGHGSRWSGTSSGCCNLNPADSPVIEKHSRTVTVTPSRSHCPLATGRMRKRQRSQMRARRQAEFQTLRRHSAQHRCRAVPKRQAPVVAFRLLRQYALLRVLLRHHRRFPLTALAHASAIETLVG